MDQLLQQANAHACARQQSERATRGVRLLWTYLLMGAFLKWFFCVCCVAVWRWCRVRGQRLLMTSPSLASSLVTCSRAYVLLEGKWLACGLSTCGC
jgi:hypothetical protein